MKTQNEVLKSIVIDPKDTPLSISLNRYQHVYRLDMEFPKYPLQLKVDCLVENGIASHLIIIEATPKLPDSWNGGIVKSLYRLILLACLNEWNQSNRTRYKPNQQIIIRDNSILGLYIGEFVDYAVDLHFIEWIIIKIGNQYNYINCPTCVYDCDLMEALSAVSPALQYDIMRTT